MAQTAELLSLPLSDKETQMLNESELNTLFEVAEKARLLRPGPWAVHDSCSWRRIGTAEPYVDANVICPITQQSDNHPDLLAEREVLDHVAAFDPTTCAELVREVLRLRSLVAHMQFPLGE